MRRSEKKVLNAINQQQHGNQMHYHVPDPKNAAKPRQRIVNAADKILILVNLPHLLVRTLLGNPARCMKPIKLNWQLSA